MCLVLHDGVGGKIEHPAQSVSNAGSGGLVTGRLVPDGNDVFLRKKGREFKTTAVKKQKRFNQSISACVCQCVFMHAHAFPYGLGLCVSA